MHKSCISDRVIYPLCIDKGWENLFSTAKRSVIGKNSRIYDIKICEFLPDCDELGDV